MKNEKFSIRSRLKSFLFAFKGLIHCIKNEHNFRIHLVGMSAAIGLSIGFNISAIEWLFIGLAISLVLIAEMFNTALENLTNLISPDRHPIAGRIKDIAAGAVLISALFSLVVAGIVFTPYILALFS